MTIEILTKSRLVGRDIVILKRLEDVDVGMTQHMIASVDGSKDAPVLIVPPQSAGCFVKSGEQHVFIRRSGPAPFRLAARTSRPVLRRLAESGVREIDMEDISLKRCIRDRVEVVLTTYVRTIRWSIARWSKRSCST